jgi:hypothetical protein
LVVCWQEIRLEPNDPFSINGVGLTRDFSAERFFEPEEMDGDADFERYKKCERDIKFRLILALIPDRTSGAARMILGLGHTEIRNIEGSRSKGGSMEDRRTDFSHPLYFHSFECDFRNIDVSSTPR